MSNEGVRLIFFVFLRLIFSFPFDKGRNFRLREGVKLSYSEKVSEKISKPRAGIATLSRIMTHLKITTGEDAEVPMAVVSIHCK